MAYKKKDDDEFKTDGEGAEEDFPGSDAVEEEEDEDEDEDDVFGVPEEDDDVM